MQNAFPVEIIELIVDELGANAYESSFRNALRSLARASTMMCMRTYKHLFQVLNLVLFLGILDDYGLVLKCQAAVDRLQNILVEGLRFPGLAMVYYIRTMSFTILCENLRQLHHTSFIPELSGILQALHGPNHGITTFRLEISQPPIRGFDNLLSVSVSESQLFSPTTYAAFRSLWRSPKLTTLQFVGTLLSSTALHGMDVQNLHLERFIFQDEEPLLQVDRHGPNSIPHPTEMTIISAHSQWTTTGFFQSVSYGDADKMTFQPLSSTRLTGLALSVDDLHADLNVFTELQSLKILMNNLSTSSTARSLPRMLQNFFFPPGRGIRNLGATVNLIIECTKYVDKASHFGSLQAQHPQRRLFATICEKVDSHLISNTQLQRIQMSFLFDFGSGNDVGDESYEDAFIARNINVIQALFPRLTASDPRFSLDATIVGGEDKELSKSRTIVGCKGPVTGWW